MSEKWRQSEICTVINDKSQGSVAKHLSWDGLLHGKFNLLLKNFFEIGERLMLLQIYY